MKKKLYTYLSRASLKTIAKTLTRLGLSTTFYSADKDGDVYFDNLYISRFYNKSKIVFSFNNAFGLYRLFSVRINNEIYVQ